MRTFTPADPSPPARPFDALVDARFVAALGLLLLNDHFLKAAYGNAMTGKLSDFAGLIVLPVVVGTALRAVGMSRAVGISVVVVGAWFALMKTSPPVASATESLFMLITQRPSSIVVDPTDLVALASLPMATLIMHRPRSLLRVRIVRVAIVGVALMACLATSADEPADYDLVVDDVTGEVSQNVIGLGCADEDFGTERCITLYTEDAFASQACLADSDLCFRIAGAIVEQRSGDGPWETVWETEEHASITGPANYLLEPIQAQDIVVDGRGQVHVSFTGGIDDIFRTAEGEWVPSVSSFRSLARLLPATVLTTVAAMLFTGTRSTTWIAVGLAAILASWAAVALFLPIGLLALSLCCLLALAAFAVKPQSQTLRPWLLIFAAPLPGVIPMLLWKYDLGISRALALSAWLVLALPFLYFIYTEITEDHKDADGLVA